jgi:hypothetical protein
MAHSHKGREQMIARREFYYQVALVVMAILTSAVITVVVAIGVKTLINDNRCEAKLGPGYSWVGLDGCSPPPVHVEGLL